MPQMRHSDTIDSQEFVGQVVAATAHQYGESYRGMQRGHSLPGDASGQPQCVYTSLLVGLGTSILALPLDLRS